MLVQRIGIIGAGKLGSPMAAALASKGFEVLVCDVDPEKVRTINGGRAPVSETGLQELIDAIGISGGYLRATASIEEAVRFADVTFVVTATPSAADGRFSLEYILPVCEEIGRVLGKPLGKPAFHPVVITSTVMPGDTWGAIRETLEKHSRRKCGESFGLCYNPEFIALGSVIHDFLNPDLVLLGASDPLSDARVSSVYERISDAPIARMSIVNAEITKLAINNFLCMKISYGNMLAEVCQTIPGANCDVVSQAVGLDSRIGAKLLKGGSSYGGPCLPRDTRAMATLTVGTAIPKLIDAFNHEYTLRLCGLVRDKVPHEYPTEILGRAYKAGTQLEIESAGSYLWSYLSKAGHFVVPDGYPWEDCKAVVVMLPDDEYKNLDYSGKIVIDVWRILPHLANDASVNYIPLGIGPAKD